jgi:hypothetical protein
MLSGSASNRLLAGHIGMSLTQRETASHNPRGLGSARIGMKPDELIHHDVTTMNRRFKTSRAVVYEVLLVGPRKINTCVKGDSRRGKEGRLTPQANSDPRFATYRSLAGVRGEGGVRVDRDGYDDTEREFRFRLRWLLSKLR